MIHVIDVIDAGSRRLSAMQSRTTATPVLVIEVELLSILVYEHLIKRRLC